MDHLFRNPRFNHLDTIDLELFTEEYGWVPFTASPSDDEPMGREIYAQAIEGAVEAYQPPSDAERRALMPVLTRRQFKLGLLENGISAQTVLQTIEAMPDGIDKEVARIEWDDATSFERLHPLVSSIGGSLGLTEAQIDAMWTAAAAL